MHIFQVINKKLSFSWLDLLAVSFIGSYMYVFMEWLFIVTQPSSMIIISFQKKIAIYFFAASLAAGLSIFFISFFLLISSLPPLNKFKNLLIRIACFQPAAILASLLLLLIDNFTYTVFSFGIISTTGFTRILYALFFLFLVVVAFRYLLRQLPAFYGVTSSFGAIRRYIYPILVGITLLSFLIPLLLTNTNRDSSFINPGSKLNKPPNILYIVGDGIDASHMSVYGYGHDTTPTIRKMSAVSLMAENAFPNSGNTAGSTIATLTGKYATTTRVLYPPNILMGIDAYQHLPGILHSLGYHTFQVSFRYFIDAFSLNMLDGFDIANGRSAATNPILKKINDYVPNDYAYFIYEIGNRLVDRLRHIFFIKKMANPYIMVNEPDRNGDDENVVTAMDDMNPSNEPFFIHMHLMGTHMSIYNIKDNYYDNSILKFDKNVGVLLNDLNSKGILNNTIVIIGTDHGREYMTTNRIPLIFRFPEGKYTGKIAANAQNLDISPTILDYLGITKPAWMKGQSLLQNIPTDRPIYAASVSKSVRNKAGIDRIVETKVKPPFYQFGLISLIRCNKWYQFDLFSSKWEIGDVNSSTDTCSKDSNLSDDQVFKMIVNHLKDNNFDTSTLDNQHPIPSIK